MPTNWVKTRLSETVANVDHMKMGIRKKLIPGARIFIAVVIMLTAVRMEERPAR